MMCGISEEAKRNKKIEREIAKWMKEYNKALKLLLLGAGESGKTTIIKQMKILHFNGFTDEEKQEKAIEIRKNVLESIVTICQNMSKVGCGLASPDNAAAMDYVIKCGRQILGQNNDAMIGTVLDQKFYDHVEALWRDEGVQSTYSQQHQYQLIDCAKYFLDKVSSIRDPSYIPDEKDILNSRRMTTDISKIEFMAPVPKKYGGGKQLFWMFDVGGQKGERQKWIQVFDGIQAVLFLVASNCYDLKTIEDDSTNRLEDSLDIFESMWRSRFLQSAGFIIFFNKQDKLKEKVVVEKKSIEDNFPEYKNFDLKPKDKVAGEDPEYLRTRCFIRELFLDISRMNFEALNNKKPSTLILGVPVKDTGPKREVYSHFTTATDTNNVKLVFEDVHNMIIMMNIRHAGIQ